MLDIECALRFNNYVESFSNYYAFNAAMKNAPGQPTIEKTIVHHIIPFDEFLPLQPKETSQSAIERLSDKEHRTGN